MKRAHGDRIFAAWRAMSLRIAATLIAVQLGAVDHAYGQCAPQWLPGDGVPGLDGRVLALTRWDPDGLGPKPPAVVAAGEFSVAGSALASNVAMFDGTAWTSLGAGTISSGPGDDATVYALAVLANGDLVAGGSFQNAGGNPASRIARWNGSNWAPLGSGLDKVVYALTVLQNGDLIAGGLFTGRVARWNGSSWSQIGSGIGSGSFDRVLSLAALGNGEFIAGGSFSSAGGISVNHIAHWNGSAWLPLGSGMSAVAGSATVNALAVFSNGDIVAGGLFTSAGGAFANGVARWNGVSWSPFGFGVGGTTYPSVKALAVLPGDALIVGGYFFNAGGVSANYIARWNGSLWQPLSSGTSAVVSALVATPAGDVFAGGEFISASGITANRIAHWDGASWSTVGSGMNNTVNSLAVMNNGDVVAGGRFTHAGETAAARIARWNGTAWSALGAGMDNDVYAVAVLPNGDLIAGGGFKTIGSLNVNYIARWDGSAWHPLGAGLGNYVRCMVVASNGDLYVGGDFTLAGNAAANHVARWDGNNWSPLGSGVLGPPNFPFSRVDALVVLPTGDVVAGGTFTIAGGNAANYVARWDGNSWHPLAQGLPASVYSLAVLPSGDLVVGGAFTTIGAIARWDGISWFPFGVFNGGVDALLSAPNGDLFAGGSFSSVNGTPAARIARLTGSMWAPLESGVSGTSVSSVQALALRPNGDLVVGGNFALAGGVVSSYVARFGCPTPCGAISSYGIGCVGSGGFTPHLTLTGCAVANGNVTLRIDQGLGGSLAFLFAGAQPASIPIGVNCLFPLASIGPPIGPLPLAGVGPGQGSLQISTNIPPGTPAAAAALAAVCGDVGVPLGFSVTHGIQFTIAGP